MKRAWTALAIAMLVAVLAVAPVGAFEVRPDKNLTGGSVRTTKPEEACGHAWDTRGPMPRTRQDEVLTRYGLHAGPHPDYEIDHLIPLCLGGSDDLSNLWPQPRRRIEETWNAEAKDRLERRMCDLVCARQIDIGTAQEAFATDWIAAYQKYFPRSTDGVINNVPPHCPSDTVVWVNLTSRIYHFSGNRNYGITKNGKYMCERDAAAAGMRAAKNEPHP